MLDEAPGARAARAAPTEARVVLRSPGEPDVGLVVSAGEARFELSAGGPLDGDAVITTDAVNRLLTLWGRRSTRRDVTITADPALWSRLATTLWPTALRWPRGGR